MLHWPLTSLGADSLGVDDILTETYASIEASRDLMAQVYHAEREYLWSIDRSLELIEASRHAIKALAFPCIGG